MYIQVAFAAAALAAVAQTGSPRPQFGDYPAPSVFSGRPADPVLITAEERRFRTVIRRGLLEGFGVQDGETGRELGKSGANFAGHYVIVQWGCGSPCLMAAIVDLANGPVLPPPFHQGSGNSYFQVPWAFPRSPALSYRRDSRLLIASICETTRCAASTTS